MQKSSWIARLCVCFSLVVLAACGGDETDGTEGGGNDATFDLSVDFGGGGDDTGTEDAAAGDADDPSDATDDSGVSDGSNQDEETIDDITDDAISDAAQEEVGVDIVEEEMEPPPTICEATCNGLYEGDACTPSDDVFITWATADACIIECESNGEADQEIFVDCVALTGCGDATPCEELPTEENTSCTSACAALNTLCGESVVGTLDPDNCGSTCTLFMHANGQADFRTGEDTTACVEESDECPDDASGQERLTYGCVIPPSEACTAMCEAVVTDCTCGPSETECLNLCADIETRNPDAFGMITSCVTAAEMCMTEGDAVPRGTCNCLGM